MQNGSVIKYLKFFHGFTKSSIYNPKQIAIPIQYKIRDAGNIVVNNTTENPVWVFEGEGSLKYQVGATAPLSSIAVFNIFFNIITVFAAYFIYFFLEKIIRSAIDKKPFSKETAGSMQKLGYILIGYGTLLGIYHFAGMLFLDGHFSSEVIQLDSFNVQFVKNTLELFFNKRTLLGFFALLVSLILRYGIELKEEQALTI